MDHRLKISLFGEPQFSFDGEPWRFAAPPKALPVLAYLLLHAGERISRVRLAAVIWPDEDEEDGRSNLRRHLHHVVRGLPAIDGVSWLVTDKTSVGWNAASPARSDVADFEDLLADPAHVARGLDLYRGDLIATLHDEWILAERGRLQAMALGAMLELSGSSRSRRNYAEAAMRAEHMLSIDEWREDAVRALMAARYESGDRSSALATYERFARRLHAEMRVAPMPETISLRNAMLADRSLPDRNDGSLESLAPAAPGRSLHVPFVGREQSMELLRAAWMRAARKSGTTLFVTGEPGIGKSRVASELASMVEMQGGRTLFGYTSSPEATPYQPLVDALRRGLPYLTNAKLDPLTLSVISPLVPELQALQPVPFAEAIEADRARARLHEAFARIFEAMARTRPLLLVLEDLHWAQADTIDALTVLTRRAGGMPILIVGTYRDDCIEAEHPLRETLRTLQRERRATVVPLARLNAHDIATLVRGMNEVATAPEHLASAAFRVSEGNPLFVSQLLQDYLETGDVPNEKGGVRGVDDAIAARVERLEGGVRAVADVAATVGREFSCDLVCDVGGWSRDLVIDAMDILMDRHLVRETGSPGFEYGFTHVLIANAIYERSDANLRSSRHRRIALCLDRANESATAATAARHWKLAGDRERASDAYARAAARAIAVYARADAVECAREAAASTDDPRRRFDALKIAVSVDAQYGANEAWDRDLIAFAQTAEHFGNPERFEALEARERYLGTTGERDAQRATIARMHEIGERTGSAIWRAKAADALGSLELSLGRAREATAPLRAAFELVRHGDDRRLRSRTHQHLVQSLIRVGDTTAARYELERLRAATPQRTELEDELDVLWAESALAIATEDTDVLRRAGTQLLAIGKRTGDEELEARANWRLGWAALVTHDIAEARERYQNAVRLFERLSQPHPLSTTLVNLGVLEFEIGQTSKALEFYARAATLAERCGSLNVAGYALANGSEAHLFLGNFATAYEQAKRAHEIAMTTGEHRLQANAVSVLGAVECASGDPARGLAHMRAGVDLWRTSQSKDSLIDALCATIETSSAHHECGDLASYAAELASLLRDTPSVRHPARGIFALAIAERANGHAAKAKVLEERARTLLTGQIARYPDEETKAGYRALPFNRAILGGDSIP